MQRACGTYEGEEEKCTNTVVAKPEGKKLPGRSSRRWELKWILKNQKGKAWTGLI